MAKRPGALPRSLRFNQIVGVDLFEFNEFGFSKWFLNVICWGTGYQMCATVPDEQSATVRDDFAMVWAKHYGMPELLITDQGPESIATKFISYVAGSGTLQHTIDSQSPWQHGRTERAGASLKEDMTDVVPEYCY